MIVTYNSTITPSQNCLSIIKKPPSSLENSEMNQSSVSNCSHISPIVIHSSYRVLSNSRCSSLPKCNTTSCISNASSLPLYALPYNETLENHQTAPPEYQENQSQQVEKKEDSISSVPKAVDPPPKKGIWTKEEDDYLRNAIKTVPKENKIDWKEIAKFVPNRCAEQCRKHWENILDPELKRLSE